MGPSCAGLLKRRAKLRREPHRGACRRLASREAGRRTAARSVGIVMADQEHFELAIELTPGAEPGHVARWLQQHGFETLPLTVGLLAVGDAAAVRATFGAEPQGELPIPQALSREVRSIAVVPPKRFHEGA
jgi:hypothetical protein